MKKKLGFILSAKFTFIILMFFTPFITVSCGGMMNISLSGTKLATGTTLQMKEPFSGKIKKQKIEAQPLALMALVASFVGLFFGFIVNNAARIVNAISGGAGIVFLLMLKNQLDSEILREGGGMIILQYEAGYWIAVLLFAAAAALSLYAAGLSEQDKNSG